MKIAVASLNKDENSEISEKAARAPYFLVFNEEGNISEVIDNTYTEETRGAGADAAELLSDKNINILIAGDIGPRMARVLEDKGIKYQAMSGSIKQAVKKIVEGK